MISAPARFWRIAGWIAACVWIATCAYYVSSPRPPFEFFADLGGYAATIGRMGAMATSPSAILSMFNWQAWVDEPAFVLFPVGTLYSALPIEIVLRDPFGSIKLLQVLQLTTAFAGTAWLFGLLFGRTPWRWFAAFAYAAMPFCTLAVRGEPDFGWILALIPVALATSLALGRRAGPWAFPLAGLICAITGGAFYIEHLVIVGIPLLVLTAVLMRNDGIAIRPYHVALGLAAFAVFPAYVVLPTLEGPHPLWFSEGYQHGVGTEDVLAVFSAHLGDQIAGVLRENLVSQDPALNASGSLPIALGAGALLWALLIAALVTSRSTARRWWPIAALAAVWTLLALGGNVPLLGPWLWGAVAAHPPLSALRTPDRFGQLTAILVALGGALGAMKMYERGGRARVFAVVASAIVVAGYGAFDLREHAIAFGTIQARLPSQPEIAAKVASADGRAATFAFSKGASLFDPAAYAMVTPTIVAAWDVAARFPGDAGVPLLRRAGIRSIVTSPVWTVDTQSGMPADMSVPVAASGLAVPAFGAPGSARLFSVSQPRAEAVRADVVCDYGGPGGFEAAAALAVFAGDALVHGEDRACDRNVYADADPLDDVLASVPARWPGHVAFDGFGFPLPSPYAYEIERFTLSQPWYRYAYYGDSILAQPFAIDDPLRHSVPLVFSAVRAERYALFVRVAGLGTLSTRDASGELVTAQSRVLRGFRWLELPLGRLRPGSYTRTLDVTRLSQTVDPLVVDVVAAAPVSVLDVHPRTDAAIVLPNEFAPPARATNLSAVNVFPKPQMAISAAPQGVRVDGKTTVGSFDGEPGIRSTEAQSRVSFVWTAPSGRYALGASAWLAGGDSTLAVVTPGGTISQAYDPGIGPIPTPARGYVRLRRGDRIDVYMTTVDLPATAHNTLLEVTAIAVGNDPEPNDYSADGEMWAIDAKNTLTFLAEEQSNAVLRRQSVPPVAPGAPAPTVFAASEGTLATMTFRPTVLGGRVVAKVAASGLLGTITLRCGPNAQSVDMGVASRNTIAATLSVPLPRATQCSFAVRWRSFDFALQSVTIRATGTSTQGWESPLYLSRGSYAWSAFRGPAPVLAIDGVEWPPDTPRVLSAGRHSLRLLRASLPLSPLVFRQPSAAKGNHAAIVLEATHLSDGYWFAGSGSGVVRGYSCDLVNTCFDTSVAGPVWHVAPPALALGMTITTGDVAVCVGIAALALIRRRRRPPG